MISAQLLATYAARPRAESQLWNHREVFFFFCGAGGADVRFGGDVKMGVREVDLHQ